MKSIINICPLVILGLFFILLNSCDKNDKIEDSNTVTDIDGNVYRTVTIGTQVWMVENLKVTRFRNGNAIPLVTENKSWSNLTTPGYCWYENDQNTYGHAYGALYNWYTANTDNLCPNGWHVPSDEEWKIMEGTVDSLYGVGNPIWDDTGYRGYDVCTRLKAANGWNSNGNGTDIFGFSALPAGYRYDGVFLDESRFSFWWSSTETSSTRAWSLGVGFNDTMNFHYAPDKKHGLSIRCLQD